MVRTFIMIFQTGRLPVKVKLLFLPGEYGGKEVGVDPLEFRRTPARLNIKWLWSQVCPRYGVKRISSKNISNIKVPDNVSSLNLYDQDPWIRTRIWGEKLDPDPDPH
jgi:hypothetical protein